jgi:hypothetical protein
MAKKQAAGYWYWFVDIEERGTRLRRRQAGRALMSELPEMGFCSKGGGTRQAGGARGEW